MNPYRLPRILRGAALGAALALGLTSLAGAAAPPPRPDTAPLAPPRVHLDAVRGGRPATALDVRMAGDPLYPRKHPEDMCGTTRSFALASRASAAGHGPRASGGGSASSLANTSVQDGIIVMENDGTLIRNDRPPDVAGRTLVATPRAPAGYDVSFAPLAYAAPTVAPRFQDQRNGFVAVSQSLPFTFNFGGKNYGSLWMTNSMGLYFTTMPPTAFATTQVPESYDLYDRTPRITPLLGGTSYYGFDGYVEVGAGNKSMIFTWLHRPAPGDPSDVEVQVVLKKDGTITMSWNALAALHGSVAIVDGNDSFWLGETEVAAWPDPAGDTGALGVPEDGAADVTGAALRQVPGTGVTRFVVDLASPPPAASGNLILYEFYFYPDAATNLNTHYEYVEVQNGKVIDGSARAEVKGSQLEVGIPFWKLGVPGSDLEMRLYTWINLGGWQWKDESRSGTVSVSGSGPTIMRDLTADLPVSQSAPFYEAFTVGELDPYKVYDTFNQAFASPPIDGLAIFQNVYTDIIFYAGAYSTVGNAGADGIGIGSKSDPPAPALLHMNALGYGWNGWEGGRTTVLNQEFGHHYAYFARIQEGGNTSDVLNPDGAHPAPWVHTPAATDVHISPDFSSFGGSYWTDNGNGFTNPGGAGTGLWGAELYLMGLVAPDEVPDWWYIANAVPGFNGQIGYWPPASVQTGTRTPVSVQQIIDNEGPRDPAYPSASRDFRVPFVLVHRPGTLQPVETQTTAQYCSEWERNFQTATTVGGSPRGTVDCFATCLTRPPGVGSTLKLVKTPPVGRVRWSWTNVSPAADSYVVYEESSKAGPFRDQLGSAPDGGPGLVLTPGAGSPRFYRVAARKGTCLGSP